MPPKSDRTTDDTAPRSIRSLREKLWPHQRGAVDFALSEKKIEFGVGRYGSGKSRLGSPAGSFDVLVEDEAFFETTVALSHVDGRAPSDPIAVAIGSIEAPEEAPEGWDLASSASKSGYGARSRAIAGGTEVDLVAKVVISRSVQVTIDDGGSPLDAAIDASPLNWPASIGQWNFSSRRGLEAFDAEPIGLDVRDAQAEPDPPHHDGSGNPDAPCMGF